MAYYNTVDFNNDNYSYDDDDTSSYTPSIATDSNLSSGINEKNKKNKIKNLDPGYFTVNRYIYNNKKNKMQKTKIGLYRSSGISDHKIRNAVTGIYEKLRVGRFESDLLYKVILATGETGNNPEQLYFDSPEQYERHFSIIVSDSVKKAWKEKYNNEYEYQLKCKSKETKPNTCIR